MQSKKIIIITTILSITFFSNANYFSFIKEKNYEIVESLIKEYSEWLNVGSEYCESDIDNKEIYYGTEVKGHEICYQKKERILDIYKLNKKNEKVFYSTEVETISEQVSESDLFGEHLESSCNDIIVNGYGSDDGVYKVGSIDDNFDVYCDMRENEGWTLLGKINTSNQASIDEPSNWFINGKNAEDVLNPINNINTGMSGLGITKINRLNLGNVTEFKLLSESLNQVANFYKESNKTNMGKWFNESEVTETKVCLDSNLGQSCRNSKFLKLLVYQLVGMNLADLGYQTDGDGFLHLRMNENQYNDASGVCSYTSNHNNNHWQDVYNTHWGNGMLIYAK